MTLTQIKRGGIAATAKDVVSVLDYIPIALHAAIRAGTSTADVTQYVQDALTYSSNKARAVFFPAGCYKCSSGIVLQTGAKLIGEGLEKSEYNIHKGTGSVIQFSGSSGITAVSKNKIEFYNIGIRGSNTFSAEYVVKFDGVYACRFHNVVIANSGSHSTAGGLFMDDDDDDSSTPTDYAWSNFFDNCLFSAPRSKGYTFYFTGSDSWFNGIYSSGGKGILTKPGGNNWSNIHCEHSYSNGSSASATGTNAGFTVFVASYANNHSKIINVSNLYVDLNDIAVRWKSVGDGAYFHGYNFSNVLCRQNGNCDFKFENSGTSSPSASGGSIINYQTKATPTTAIKTSGTISLPFIQTEGSSITNKKIGIETDSPNVLLDVGGSSTTGLSGLTNSTFYTGFSNNTSFGGVVMGAGPNGNTPFVAASKLSNGTALPLSFYTNGTKRLSILNNQAGICFGSENTAAHCLDDYEEGTWVPSISGRTLSTASGQFTKIGRIVICRFAFSGLNSSITSPSVAGLPVNSMGVDQIGICQVGDVRGVSYGSGYSNIYGRVNANSNSIEFLQQKIDGSGHSTNVTFGTNVIIRGFVTYFAS